MTRYRPHRGGLVDSMREVVEVKDEASLRQLLGVSASDRVVVAPYGFDARIGWDAHIVTVNGLPAGFTDGPIGGGPHD